ncbi:MAG: crosslink repair DNA glycosylase YcaQ family protein [Spirochaetia bacterium]
MVRSWLFRGTLHYVEASDLGWLTALFRPCRIRANHSRYAQLERVATEAEQLFVCSKSLETADPEKKRLIHLLAPFDEFILGYRDRSAFLNSSHSHRVNPGGGMN